MAQRRYGPVQGAGTVLIEREGGKQLAPGALGVTFYIGAYERGPVGELITTTGAGDFLRKLGGRIPESLAPDAAQDFWSLGRGSGLLLAQRVTDGNEVKAELTLYNRKAARSPVIKIEAGNGGRWAGRKTELSDVLAGGIADVTANVVDTGLTMLTDHFAGASFKFEELAQVFTVVSNDTDGLLTFAPDIDVALLARGLSSYRWDLQLDNRNLLQEVKQMQVEVRDGQENPTTEFGLYFYLDGALLLRYSNLSMDPDSARYFENVINNDPANYSDVEVEDLWTPNSPSADSRPALEYGLSSTLTSSILTIEDPEIAISSLLGADPTVGTFTYGADAINTVYTLTCTADAISGSEVLSVVDNSGRIKNMPDCTVGVAYVPGTRLGTGWKIIAGLTDLAIGDVITVYANNLVTDELIGGRVWPDKVNFPNVSYEIIDNDLRTVTAQIGSDMTKDGTVSSGEAYLLRAPQSLEGGYDGLADIGDADYQAAMVPASSPLLEVAESNYGLVKMAAPGLSSTLIQKAGMALAEALNYQWRCCIPVNITDEILAVEHVNNTLGRNDFAVVIWPSFGDVPDPDGEAGTFKSVDVCGMVHGREAQVARNYDGYHKAAAGIDVILSRLSAIPTGSKVLNEELLNPQGLQVLLKKKGNYVVWGDRSLALDPTWKWKHQREQMSHYEQVLRENFDWIIFSINDAEGDAPALTALTAYFLKEWRPPKRALRGATFASAVSIKIDEDNNTDVTRADGDKNAEVTLRLADTTERFIITIGKAGIFEDLTA